MRAQQIQLTAAWPQAELIVLCSEIGLEQVLTNLLSNAADAMGESAGVSGTASATESTFGRIEIEVEQHGDWVDIRIADSGPGIAATSIEKIFDPFHTTKDQGLGLGLSISAGILRSAGGRLSVRNRSPAEGGGAQFTIRLAKG